MLFYKKYFLLVITYIAVLYPACAQDNTYSLRRALQTARLGNPSLKSGAFNISISGADSITARLRPNIILNNQSLQLARPSQFPADAKWYNAQNRQVWWQVTKLFQLPAQRKYKIKFANANIQVATADFLDAQRNILVEIAAKWLDVWVAGKQLEVTWMAKANIDSIVSTNRVRLKNEVITSTDLVRTELLAAQYALQIRSAEQTYKNEQGNLAFLIGAKEIITIDTTDDWSFVMSSGIDSILQQALNTRSDIAAVRARIQSADANIKWQKALAWPQPELGVIYNPQNTIPYLGIFGTIEIPLFSRNQGERKKSMLLRQQAEQDLYTTQLQISNELMTAYHSYLAAGQNVHQFKGVLQQAEQVLANVRYAYLHGGTTVIDFLEAQRSWLDTQQQYYETLKDYRQSYIRLLYTSGFINQLAL